VERRNRTSGVNAGSYRLGTIRAARYVSVGYDSCRRDHEGCWMLPSAKLSDSAALHILEPLPCSKPSSSVAVPCSVRCLAAARVQLAHFQLASACRLRYLGLVLPEGRYWQLLAGTWVGQRCCLTHEQQAEA
jgi:hypothetical protein